MVRTEDHLQFFDIAPIPKTTHTYNGLLVSNRGQSMDLMLHPTPTCSLADECVNFGENYTYIYQMVAPNTFENIADGLTLGELVGA